MYLSQLNIEGYKNTKSQAKMYLNKGLNVLVGENGSGKTAIINALRLLVRENEFPYMMISEDDFYQSLDKTYQAKNIKIDAVFSELDENEQVTFLTWCNEEFDAILHLEINENPNRAGTYKKIVWGGNSRASMFEEETFENIECIYLPPLRDAEEKLTNGRKSRLAKLLAKQYGENTNNLVESVKEFNNTITSDTEGKYREIYNAKTNINKKLTDTLGERFGQSINLQFAEMTFNKIVESIKMVFFPNCKATDINVFRDLATNSLGYNNFLYIATVFSELELLKENNLLTLLLIEEPEAHLHPQLQIKFIKYLESLANDLENAQIIITTHSPVLASSVEINKLIHIENDDEKIIATTLSKINFGDSKSENFINRWLDATKSTMLFSKGIIFVEGISEAILIPKLAEIVLSKYNMQHDNKLPSSLEEAGISVININGIYFKHFMKLFSNIDGSSGLKLPIYCAGISDRDPKKNYYPIKFSDIKSKNPVIKFRDEINESKYGRLFLSPYKTFEYDLILENNAGIMASVLKNIWTSSSGKVIEKLDKIIEKDNDELPEQQRDDARYIYNLIANKSIGKGFYAQSLAEMISNDFSNFKVPKYISQAVIWTCGEGCSDE